MLSTGCRYRCYQFPLATAAPRFGLIEGAHLRVHRHRYPRGLPGAYDPARVHGVRVDGYLLSSGLNTVRRGNQGVRSSACRKYASGPGGPVAPHRAAQRKELRAPRSRVAVAQAQLRIPHSGHGRRVQNPQRHGSRSHSSSRPRGRVSPGRGKATRNRHRRPPPPRLFPPQAKDWGAERARHRIVTVGPYNISKPVECSVAYVHRGPHRPCNPAP